MEVLGRVRAFGRLRALRAAENQTAWRQVRPVAFPARRSSLFFVSRIFTATSRWSLVSLAWYTSSKRPAPRGVHQTPVWSWGSRTLAQACPSLYEVRGMFLDSLPGSGKDAGTICHIVILSYRSPGSHQRSDVLIKSTGPLLVRTALVMMGAFDPS